MKSGVDNWKRDLRGTGKLLEGRYLVNRSALVAMLMGTSDLYLKI